MKKITLEDFRADVLTAMANKPKEWRDGQFVFNYIDEKYRVARYVQFINGVDCFHNDEKIDEFIVRCYETMMSAETYRDVFDGQQSTEDSDSNV
jgi:hypothetical protein